MSAIDHIEELRAELAHGVLTKRERARIEAELKAAHTRRAVNPTVTPSRRVITRAA